MSKTVPRDISTFLQKFRKMCFAGREFQSHVRHEGVNVVARTQPLPNIPGGVNHKLRNNYYYSRDARRTSRPPEMIYVNKTLAPPQAQEQLKAN